MGLLAEACNAGYRKGQRRRTMVSIFCSSEPFSKEFLRSFWEGMSAALSWWTC